MFRAMAWKELREMRGIAIAGIVAHCYLAAAAINPQLPPWGTRQTTMPPFVDDGFFGGWFVSICVIVAIAIGLRQTLGESVGGTYPYLFHRAATRRWLICVKLLVGIGAYLIGPPLAILGYGYWAATPETRASPFQWAMTGPYWIIWLVMTLPYLGAFLSGLRPGRWFGSRLLPLVAVAPVAIAISISSIVMCVSYWSMLVTFVVGAWLVAMILFVARGRDYT